MLSVFKTSKHFVVLVCTYLESKIWHLFNQETYGKKKLHKQEECVFVYFRVIITAGKKRKEISTGIDKLFSLKFGPAKRTDNENLCIHTLNIVSGSLNQNKMECIKFS